MDSGRVTLVAGFAATAVRTAGGQVILVGETEEGERELGPIDRIVVATGQRPDLSLTRELRLDLDPWIERQALGPLIDPNLHSCGSVPPMGIANSPTRNRGSTRRVKTAAEHRHS